MGPKSACRFQRSWLLESSPYHSWIQEAKFDTDAMCKFCKKVINLSHMGEAALRSHTNSAKHQQYMLARKDSLRITELFSRPQHSPKKSTASQPISSTASQSSSSEVDDTPQPGAERGESSNAFKRFKVNEAVIEAEVLWCLNIVMTHASLRDGSSSAALFTRMFSDSETASHMTLSKDKIRYTIIHGLAPYFSKELSSAVQQCEVYVLLFDESLNKVVQRGQMDIHVRFSSEKCIVTRYLTSVFLGRTRSEDLLSAFEEGTKDLDKAKLLQVSMDGPNVNLKFLRLLNASRADDVAKPQLLDCGTCSLHVVCGSLKTADESSDYWHIGRFLKAIYYVFKDSPMRRALLLELNNLSKSAFPMKFCATRWVENGQVSARALDLIPRIKEFVRGVANKSHEPKSSSYVYVKKTIEDKLLCVKIAFFNNQAVNLEEFLEAYQTDAPMMPFMYEDLFLLVKKLLSSVVKAEVVEGKSAKELCNLDLDKERLLKEAKDVTLGFAVREQLRKCRSQLTTAEIGQFRKECRSFIITIVKKLVKNCPLHKNIVKGATCLNPLNMTDERKASSRVDMALQELVACGRLSGNSADKAKQQYNRLLASDEVKQKCKKYSRKTRLDTFVYTLLSESGAPVELHRFVTILLCLSHGQATVERGFNINKELLADGQRENSVIAQRVVHDAVSNAGVELKHMKITKNLLHSAQSSARRYKEYLAEQKKNAEADKQMQHEKRRTTALIKEKESERKRLKTQHELEILQVEEQLLELKKNVH